MVWGCFGSGKIGDLNRVEGTLRKDSYHKILQCHAKPCEQHLIGASFILQQDNDLKPRVNLIWILFRQDP